MSLNNQSNALAELGRREDALAAITEAVALYREVAAARPDAFRPDLAASLNNQCNRLAELGRRGDALAAITEAVAIYREVAAARPDAFRPDLALSLTQPVHRVGGPGPARGRAGRHHRSRRNPPGAGRHTPCVSGEPCRVTDLICDSAHRNGRLRWALTADREAVAIYAALLSHDPDRYRDPLDGVVRNLVIDLRDLGRGEQEIADELDSLLSADND